MTFVNLLFESSQNWSATVSRVVIGLIIFPHGCQRMFDWFGGDAYSGTIERITKKMGYPWIIAFMILFTEFFRPLFLIIGLGTRIIAMLLIILMSGAILTVHKNYGYFLNWHNTKEGEGMQFNLLIIGICIVVFIEGAGKYGLDNYINRIK